MTTYFKARDWAVDKVFKYRFFYLAEYKLLGIFGVPDAVKNLFDASIEFQNSCDQDYEYDHWDGVKIFEEIAKKWENASDEDIRKNYIEKYRQIDDEDDFDYDYYRRSFAYDEIWNIVGDFLNDDAQALFFTLYGPYEYSVLKSFTSTCKKEYQKFHEEEFPPIVKHIKELQDKAEEKKKENTDE